MWLKEMTSIWLVESDFNPLHFSFLTNYISHKNNERLATYVVDIFILLTDKCNFIWFSENIRFKWFSETLILWKGIRQLMNFKPYINDNVQPFKGSRSHFSPRI